MENLFITRKLQKEALEMTKAPDKENQKENQPAANPQEKVSPTSTTPDLSIEGKLELITDSLDESHKYITAASRSIHEAIVRLIALPAKDAKNVQRLQVIKDQLRKAEDELIALQIQLG